MLDLDIQNWLTEQSHLNICCHIWWLGWTNNLHARGTVKSERGVITRRTWTTGRIWKIDTIVTLILIYNLSIFKFRIKRNKRKKSQHVFWFNDDKSLSQMDIITLGKSSGSVIKNLPANTGDAGDTGVIPGSGGSPGGGNGSPLQYSCLDNSMDWGA